MNGRVPDAASERRLDELRAEAETKRKVAGTGVHPAGAPFPVASPTTGYYGVPLLKPPTWTWEVPLYFFVGGAAGTAAVIGFAAQLSGADRKLVRDARLVAAAGGALSAPLLIADLGRPERFLNMLRIFKPQSPMSNGAWILTLFGSAAGAAAFADLVEAKLGGNVPVRVIGDVASAFAAAGGLGMATYTGVLVGVTAIPVWARNAELLPAHFGASGAGSAASLLELMGNEDRALDTIALAAAMFETITGFFIETKTERAFEPLRHGDSGMLTRAGGMLSGPIPFLLRLLGWNNKNAQRAAAASTLLGSLITRFAWVEAGKVSSRDAAVPLELDGLERTP